MDDEDPRIDELEAEIARLRELVEHAAELFEAHFLPQTAARFRRELKEGS